MEEKTVEILEKWSDNLEKVGQKLSDLAVSHGDEAVDLILTVARVDAASVLIYGLLFTAVSIVWGYVSFGRYFRWAMKEAERCADPGPWLLWVFTGVGPTAVSTIIGASGILNIWAWAGVIEPKLWVAKKLLSGVM